MSLNTDIRNLGKWLNEEQTAPIDRQALARLLTWAQMADRPAAWVYPEFFEGITKAGCWTAYAGDGSAAAGGVQRLPLYRGPQTGGDERRHIICLCPDCTKPAHPKKPVAWSERWYGSGPERGWWIVCGRDHIAYLGESEFAEDAVNIIVTAHNQPHPQAREPEQPAQHLSGPCGCGKQNMAWCAANTCSKAEQPAQQWTDETAKVPDHVWGTPPFRFRRFVYGQERAQDVLIEREETLERAIKKAARICPPSEMTVLVYEGPRPQAREPLTDAMVVEAARMLSDRQAAACNVDCGDMWKMHGNEFIDDARAALEAAHGIKGEK